MRRGTEQNALDFPSRGTTRVRRGIFGIITVFMGNLGSIVDSIAHPDIPYFDGEHLLTGGITVLAMILLLSALEVYLVKHQRVECTLRVSEERLRDAQRVAGLGYYTLDVAAGTWTSSTILDGILGIGPESRRDVEAWSLLVHPDERLRMIDYFMNDVVGRRRPFDREYRIVRPSDQSVRWVHGLGRVECDAANRPVTMIGTIQDITARKQVEEEGARLEAQLVQAQKMESVGRLAGGVAHDFNNLLCVILGYGKLVADELGPASPLSAHLAEIIKAGHAAEALTRQLLAFSRRQVLQPRVLDLNVVVRGVETMLRRLIGEDITLVVAPTATPAVVRVDAGQMEQVLLNLAVNSRDAMPKGGCLTIRTALERGGGRWGTPGGEIPVGPWVVLSVADTGTGMDAATQARVFEPFFTTKPAGSGTGLGLATVYGIVSQSGGRVNFSTAPGEGTEFRVHLPRLALDAEDDDLAPVDIHAYDGKETVLLAEDQEPVRELMRLWLGRRGYRVLEAPDGRAGIDVAAEHEGGVDLLVTDVVMPRANGRELASALRARDPGLPVIYVSGYTSDAIAHRGVLEPGCRLLDKPVSEAVLLRAVREALDAAKAPAARGDGSGHEGTRRA